jgi:hypothetical protein
MKKENKGKVPLPSNESASFHFSADDFCQLHQVSGLRFQVSAFAAALNPRKGLVVAAALEVVAELGIEFGGWQRGGKKLDPSRYIDQALQMTGLIAVPVSVIGNDLETVFKSLGKWRQKRR